jgi:molecular chaperone DnaK (HSP70)
MTLDRWIFQDVLHRLGLHENDPRVHRSSAELLHYCESVKIALTENESVVFDFFPERSFLLTRADLGSLFRQNGLYETLNTILEEALRTAEDHGFIREALTAVVPVGGSSLIPLIREALAERFPAEKLIFGEPLGAVARGAAIIAGGMHIYDFIQHSYAIRYTDPHSGEYAFRTIIPKGTKYPEKQVTSVMKLKASFDGQERFGIAIYELQETFLSPVSQNEIFFDADGAVHVMPLTETESHNEHRFWMNERNPLFLTAEPGTEKGAPYFEVTFGIDRNKMLTITAVDLKKNRMVLDTHPVLRLV